MDRGGAWIEGACIEGPGWRVLAPRGLGFQPRRARGAPAPRAIGSSALRFGGRAPPKTPPAVGRGPAFEAVPSHLSTPAPNRRPQPPPPTAAPNRRQPPPPPAAPNRRPQPPSWTPSRPSTRSRASASPSRPRARWEVGRRGGGGALVPAPSAPRGGKAPPPRARGESPTPTPTPNPALPPSHGVLLPLLLPNHRRPDPRRLHGPLQAQPRPLLQRRHDRRRDQPRAGPGQEAGQALAGRRGGRGRAVERVGAAQAAGRVARRGRDRGGGGGDEGAAGVDERPGNGEGRAFARGAVVGDCSRWVFWWETVIVCFVWRAACRLHRSGVWNPSRGPARGC